MKNPIWLGLGYLILTLNAVTARADDVKIFVRPDEYVLQIGDGYDPITRKMVRAAAEIGDKNLPKPEKSNSVEIQWRLLSNDSFEATSLEADARANSRFVAWSAKSSYGLSKATEINKRAVKVQLTIKVRTSELRAKSLKLSEDALADYSPDVGIDNKFLKKYGAVVLHAIENGGFLSATLTFDYASEEAAKKMTASMGARVFTAKTTSEMKKTLRSYSNHLRLRIEMNSTHGYSATPSDIEEFAKISTSFIKAAKKNPEPFMGICRPWNEVLTQDTSAAARTANWVGLGYLKNTTEPLVDRLLHLEQVLAMFDWRSDLVKNPPGRDYVKKLRAAKVSLAEYVSSLPETDVKNKDSLTTKTDELQEIVFQIADLEKTKVEVRKRVEYRNFFPAKRVKGSDGNLGDPPYNLKLSAGVEFDSEKLVAVLHCMLDVAEPESDWTEFRLDERREIPIPELMDAPKPSDWPEVANIRLPASGQMTTWSGAKMKAPFTLNYSSDGKRTDGADPADYPDWKKLEFQLAQQAFNEDGFAGVHVHFLRDIWVNTEMRRVVVADR